MDGAALGAATGGLPKAGAVIGTKRSDSAGKHVAARKQGLGFWIRFLGASVIASGVSLGGAILVSLIVSGELPWFTTGWRHLIAEIVLFVVFLGGLIGFFVWEERRYRAKQE